MKLRMKTGTGPTQNGPATVSEEDTVPLLGKFGLLLMTAILGLAAWWGLTPIVFLLCIILAGAGAAKLWSRLSLSRVSYERSLASTRAFPGETVGLSVRLSNRKLLPLAWLEWEDRIPRKLPARRTATGETFQGNVQSSVSLLWYSRATWMYELACERRGYYELGPALLRSGDIFGFYPRVSPVRRPDSLVVYPRVVPVRGLDFPPRQPLGEMRTEHRIFQDPTRIAGARPYVPGDAFKHIHWKASARNQDLQVKVFEPSTTLEALLILAVDSFAPDALGESEEFEQAVSTAASIANNVVENRYSVGLLANTVPAGHEGAVRLMASESQQQFMRILESLARVKLAPREPLETFLAAESGSLPWGATLIVVAGRLRTTMVGALDGLAERGHKVAVVAMDSEAAGGLSPRCRVFSHHVSRGHDGRDQIELERVQ